MSPTRALRRGVVLAAIAAAALLALAGSGAGAAEQPTALRVLFLGNSLTAANELPEMVVALGRARGVSIEYGAFTPGGYSLEDHWAAGQGRALLASTAWDVVVLQQGPSALPASQVDLRRWATAWADEARARGAAAALYTVWPESYRQYALPTVIASYSDAAAAAGAVVLPAGAAWREAWRRNRKLPLYGPDGFHPSTTGTYLAALTIYAGLTGTSPVGLPRVVRTPRVRVSLSAKTARTLQVSARVALANRASRQPPAR
jgi:hypothetical protein